MVAQDFGIKLEMMSRSWSGPLRYLFSLTLPAVNFVALYSDTIVASLPLSSVTLYYQMGCQNPSRLHEQGISAILQSVLSLGGVIFPFVILPMLDHISGRDMSNPPPVTPSSRDIGYDGAAGRGSRSSLSISYLSLHFLALDPSVMRLPTSIPSGDASNVLRFSGLGLGHLWRFGTDCGTRTDTQEVYTRCVFGRCLALSLLLHAILGIAHRPSHQSNMADLQGGATADAALRWAQKMMPEQRDTENPSMLSFSELSA